MLTSFMLLLLSLLMIIPLIRCDDDQDLFSFIHSSPNASARTHPDEIQAVYDVMAATGNSWVTSIPDVCNGRWHGIECTLDISTNLLHVVSLSFGVLSDDTAFPVCSSNSTISPSISKLKRLRRLFFYRCCNQNPQPIPPHLGELGASLESLVLRENGHAGPIPDELSNVTKLDILDLHGNDLDHFIPPSLGKLQRVHRLDLSNNRLTGPIPGALGQLQNLIILDLSGNNLQGEIPADLSSLSRLKKLDMSSNKITGSLPGELGQLRSLLFLDLSRNQLTGSIPASFGGMTSLQNLILRKNRLSSTIPESLGNMSSLQVLVLSSSNMVGSIPSALGNLRSLNILHLQNNKLNGSIPAEILHLPHLSELNLAVNLLSGPVPVSRETVERLGKRLRLMNNSNLCFSSEGHHRDLAGIQQCTQLNGYSQPSQISMPINPQTQSSSRSLRSTNWSLCLILLVLSLM